MHELFVRLRGINFDGDCRNGTVMMYALNVAIVIKNNVYIHNILYS